MPALTWTEVAQQVIDRLNRQEDYSESLGQLCAMFVNSRKAKMKGLGLSARVRREILHDHDRVISYLWERATQMLQKTVPKNPRHLFYLLNRLFHFCYTDVYRKEDKNKPGGSHTQRHSKARTEVVVVSGSASIRAHATPESTGWGTLSGFDLFGCFSENHDIHALDAQEEIAQLLLIAERNSCTVRPRYRGFFAAIIFALLNGDTMKEVSIRYNLTESRISQMFTGCLQSLVVVLRGRYPAMAAIPEHTLFMRIHSAINKLKPARRRGRKGGSNALSDHGERKD